MSIDCFTSMVRPLHRVCERCAGSGRAPRQESEMRPGLHPVLSRSFGLCPACGGAGVRLRAAAEIAAAAKEAERPVPLPECGALE